MDSRRFVLVEWREMNRAPIEVSKLVKPVPMCLSQTVWGAYDIVFSYEK